MIQVPAARNGHSVLREQPLPCTHATAACANPASLLLSGGAINSATHGAPYRLPLLGLEITAVLACAGGRALDAADESHLLGQRIRRLGWRLGVDVAANQFPHHCRFAGAVQAAHGGKLAFDSGIKADSERHASDSKSNAEFLHDM